VNQEISNVTKAQFLKNTGPFTRTVIDSINSTYRVDVVITNVTETYTRRKLSSGVPSVTVQYQVTFFYPQTYTPDTMLSLYATLSNNLMNQIASGSFADALIKDCPVCGSAYSVPSFERPVPNTSFEPTTTPTVIPSLIPIAKQSLSSSSTGTVNSSTLLLAVVAIMAILLAVISFLLIMMRMKRKRNITEKRLEHWLDSDTAEVDINKKVTTLRKGLSRSAPDEPGIKDIYELTSREKVSSAYNPVFYEPSKSTTKDEDGASFTDNVKRQSLRNFVSTLQELRKEKYNSNVDADISTISDMFKNETSTASKMSAETESQDLAKILRKFHVELQNYRDKSSEIQDPTSVSETNDVSKDQKDIKDSDISIVELYKDDSNTYFTDV